MTKITIDLGGTTATRSIDTTYTEGSPNPTVTLFPDATVVTSPTTGTAHYAQTLTISLSSPTAGESLALGTLSPDIAADFSSAYDAATGALKITYTGPTTPQTLATDANWTSVLQSVTFTDTNAVAGGTTQAISITATSAGGTYTNIVTGTDTMTFQCFCAGTMIRTPEGEKAVETLVAGDLVSTSDGRALPVRWLGRQTVSTLFGGERVAPVRIRAGALAANAPTRDLLVSPDHALFVDGALIQAGALVNGGSILRERATPRVFTYYHVELDTHELIVAEGAPTESFVDNLDRLGFDNWDEHQAAFPKGKTVEEMPYPRVKSARQVPVATRILLAERADRIGVAAAVA